MGSTERRRSVRLVPEVLTYVAVRPEFDRMGKVLDISNGGLRFRYMASRRASGHTARDVDLDVFISDNGYYLPGVPCRLVYDRREQVDADSSLGVAYRQCGLAFGALRNDQRHQIDLYLKEHTDGTA